MFIVFVSVAVPNALARHAITLVIDPAFTAASQWFERTLDDSANKRSAIPEAYLTVDAVMLLMHNVASGMVVYPEMIRRRLMEELPFMATENLMMRAARKGGDRQDLHERVRVHSREAGRCAPRCVANKREQDGSHDENTDAGEPEATGPRRRDDLPRSGIGVRRPNAIEFEQRGSGEGNGARAEDDDTVLVTSPGPTIQGCEASTITNHHNAHQHAFEVQQY